MKVLFVHQNFPAQYRHVSGALAKDPGNEVVALGVNRRPVPADVRMIYYPEPKVDSQAHFAARDFDVKAHWGEATARAATDLKNEGFTPDLICGHPGWGEMMFLRDVWPDARTLSFMEFFFRSTGGDFAFEPGEPPPPSHYHRLRARNAPLLMSIEAADWCVSPTAFQWRQLPDFARERTSIIHEGIDTQSFRRNVDASVDFGRDKITCRPGDEVITFVNRNLEPYRGFHIFMRALPEIFKQRPKARAVLVGADGASYGPRPQGTSWKAIYTKEVADRVDFSRVHFVGSIPYHIYRSLLQVSAAHVYLTYPFVLSWSMLEAMAAECLIIGSRTAPVEEVIEHGRNGLLVDFFSPAELAETVIRALDKPKAYREMRAAARKTILDRFDLNICLPRQLQLVADVAAGRRPADRYVPASAEDNGPPPGMPLDMREPTDA